MILSESTAIAAYLLAVYGGGGSTSSQTSAAEATSGTAPPPRPRLSRAPGDPDYAAYLEWFHFANGTLQASMFRQMAVALSVSGENNRGNGNAAVQRGRARLERELRLVDAQLGRTGAWLAGPGPDPSAADCMVVFSLTTMRGFVPVDLAAYPHILRYLGRVAARPAYRRALARGDGGMEPMVGSVVRRFTEFEALKGVLEKL